jgi:hypothetical protein
MPPAGFAAPAPLSAPATFAAPTPAYATSGYPPSGYAPPGYPPPTFGFPGQAPANPFAAPAGYAPAGYAPSGFAAQPVFGNPPPQSWPAKLGLVVPQYAVETGDLPRICVVSGLPTDTMVRMRWMWSPAWSYLLGLLIRYLVADKVAGYLPIHPSVRRRHRLTMAAAIAAFPVGLVVMVAGAAAQAVAVVFGVALWIGAIAMIALRGRLVPVKRAAPGFLAIPKASPAFAAAFRAGRPAGQVPYSTTPATFRTRTVFIVLGVVLLVPVIFFAVAAGVHQSLTCQASSVHPYRQHVEDALQADNQSLQPLAVQSDGAGWTPQQGQQVLTADATMTTTLQGLTLKAADGLAVDGYLGQVSEFDQSLRVYMASGSAADETAFIQAGTARNGAAAALDGQLASVPADCSGSS